MAAKAATFPLPAFRGIERLTMPNPTIYLTEEEENWLSEQDKPRSRVLREALEEYRADSDGETDE